MGETFDLMGYLILVFFIMVIVVCIIKILLMFPGLLECDFVCSSLRGAGSEEEDLELGGGAGAGVESSGNAPARAEQRAGQAGPDKWQPAAEQHALLSRAFS